MAWPPPDDDVLEALRAAWHDGSWGQYASGHVERLERAVAESVGVEHVLTCASGTLAVETALRAAGVCAGDEVILAGYDYGGNFLSVHAVGASPVLVDVVPENVTLSPARLAEALGPRVKAVIVSHLHGGLADMPAITGVCAGRAVVIEDAAQCPGATAAGRPAGAWGDVGVWSFGGSKLLSAGRGGALFTRRADLAQRARLCLGRGNNLVAPLSELQAIVLLPQLAKLPARHAQRLRAVERLRGIPGLTPFTNAGAGSPGYYKVGFRCADRARFLGVLDAGFRAAHAGRAKGRYRAAGPLEESRRAGEEVAVLHHPVLLDDAELDRVVEALRKASGTREGAEE
ncbi:MAG: DegT/DnrJ/EryC1/StrS family aminotransferase [Gemmataceae bacterium]